MPRAPEGELLEEKVSEVKQPEMRAQPSHQNGERGERALKHALKSRP